MGDIPEPQNCRFLGEVSATPYDFDAPRAPATRACYDFVLSTAISVNQHGVKYWSEIVKGLQLSDVTPHSNDDITRCIVVST